MNFNIDSQYLTGVTVTKKFISVPAEEDTSEDALIRALKGTNQWTSTHFEDHPEFDKLRNQLEELGYIKTQRSWWNGDTVLKPFSLNGAKFKRGEQFCSGAAIKWTINYKLKKQKKKISRVKHIQSCCVEQDTV